MLPAATLAGADPSGATWQSWTDQLVYAVLAGLVWGGTKLAAAEEEHTRVMEALTAYMAARPIKVWPQHTPFRDSHCCRLAIVQSHRKCRVRPANGRLRP